MNANDHDRRLEEVAAYAIGGLDPERVEELERHLADCKRCQEELRWLSPAVQALPEAVEPPGAAAGAEAAADGRGARRRRRRGAPRPRRGAP